MFPVIVFVHGRKKTSRSTGGYGGIHEIVLVYRVPDGDVVGIEVAPEFCEGEGPQLRSVEDSDTEHVNTICTDVR